MQYETDFGKQCYLYTHKCKCTHYRGLHGNTNYNSFALHGVQVIDMCVHRIEMNHNISHLFCHRVAGDILHCISY